MKKVIAVVGAGATSLAVSLVVTHEGLRQQTYRDPIGIVTACYGHTGPELKLGQRYTLQQCQAMLEDDLARHAEYLGCIKKPLSDHQKAAFLSFVFNVGGSKFCSSTLVRKANQGDLAGACSEMLRWTMAGGRELPGLVSRRRDEYQVCMKGDT